MQLFWLFTEYLLYHWGFYLKNKYAKRHSFCWVASNNFSPKAMVASMFLLGEMNIARQAHLELQHSLSKL